MQNEELQRVFNLSEHQNNRYGGFVLPFSNEKAPNKTKKFNPRKKNSGADMVTAPIKNVIRRKPKNKSSIDIEDVVMNGVNTVNNAWNHAELNPYVEKYKSGNFNHLNNASKSEIHSWESINNFISRLNKDVDTNVNHWRLAGISKHADTTNHTRNLESPNAALFSRTSYHTPSEYEMKSNVNNIVPRKLNNNMALGKMKKTEEFPLKDADLLRLLPNYTPKLVKSSSLYDNFSPKQDARFADCRKYTGKESEKKAPEVGVSKTCENKLFLRSKRRKQNRSKWRMDGGTRHEALQRIAEGFKKQEYLQNDLFPLNVGETGFDKSDSDSSEEYSNTFQNKWFHSMSEIEFDDVKRNFRLGQLYNELRRQLWQIKQNKCDLPILTKTFMRSLVDATRTRPNEVTKYIQDLENQRTTTLEPLILSKKKCAVEGCKNVSLPCMSTCINHILLCEKQTLFEQCRVRDSNNFQCDKPVLNIKYHYPVCSLHSKPDFVLPDFSREGIKYEEVRNKNTTSCSDTYKIDLDFAISSSSVISAPFASSKFESRRRNNANSSKNDSNARSSSVSEKKERERKTAEKKETKTMKNEETKPASAIVKPKENVVKEVPQASVVPEVNQHLLRDWTISDSQLVDTKSLENTLPNDFVNGFDINTSSIQSQIQDIINSESSLSTDMLIGSHELPNYIQVEEMIEEVEITDETLESTELNNQELVRSEDLNAVLKQLPPEAFNELFSDKTVSQWTEAQALERVIEEMDVRKCALIDPSLLLEDIEPSYSNYSNNYDSTALGENVDTKFNDMAGNCGQSRS